MHKDAQHDEWGEQASPGIDLQELLLFGVGRSWFWVVLLGVLGAAAGLYIGASKPNVYTSRAELRFTPGRRETFSVETLTGQDSELRLQPGLVDEVILLSNPDIIYPRVAERLSPGRIFEVPDPRAQDGPKTSLPVRYFHELQAFLFERWATEVASDLARGPEFAIRAAGTALWQATVLDVVRGATLITVEHTAATPLAAQEFLTALLEDFVVRHHEVYTVTPFLEQISGRVSSAEERLADAQGDFLRHQRECGFFDLQRDKGVILAQLDEMAEQQDETLSEKARLKSEIEALQASLVSTRPEFEEVASGPPAVDRETEYLMTRRLDTRWELLMLDTMDLPFQEANDKRESLEKQMATIDTLLEQLHPEGSAMTSVVLKRNQEYDRLQTRIFELTATRQGLEALATDLDARQKEAAAARDALLACEKRHHEEHSKIDSLATALGNLRSTASEMVDLSGLDASNLSILNSASLPIEKDGPQRSKIFLAGAFAGLAAGIGLAVVRQLLDRFVRYPSALGRRLGVPVLGVVPETRQVRRGLAR